MSVVELSERDLCAALRRGDEAAFTRLVALHHASLRRVALSYVRTAAVADEVVQETWLAVLRGVDNFEERSSLKTWIFRILTNKAKTRAERESRTVPLSALPSGAADEDESAVDPNRFFDQQHARWPGHWASPPARWTDPVTTTTSGSSVTARFATAIPMYFAVSRTTETDTPSPARAPSNTCTDVIASRSPARSSTAE